MDINVENPEFDLEIYQIRNYAEAGKDFIANNAIFMDAAELAREFSEHDEGYHFRVHNHEQYIFFGDVDHFGGKIEEIRDLLREFLVSTYDLDFEDHEFKYTMNDVKSGSYHYSLPKWNASTEKLREIHQNFVKSNKKRLMYKDGKKTSQCIDTSIYSEHWYRCPNQSKGTEIKAGKHIIKNGTMMDFIISHIPATSININDKCSIKTSKKLSNSEHSGEISESGKLVELPNMKKDTIAAIDQSKNQNQVILYQTNEDILTTTMTKPEIYKRMFDECYKQERFERYDCWVSVGMALKNTFGDIDKAFDLFDYYSSKGSNYEGYEKTKFKFKTFTTKTETGYTVATIYYYAMEDNKPKFIEIMNKNTFELGQTDMCKYLKIIAGHKFLYKKTGDQYKLYCYNGKYWENDDTIMRQCISEELFNFLKMVLIGVYWNSKEFLPLKSKIDKLKTISYKKDMVETYKEIGVNNEIKFDNKWKLFGFNNTVYDTEEEEFRDYKYDDYISMTTGYDWREPTNEELLTIENLLKTIMPEPEERKLYLQILSTSIDGRCLEKFIIFNGGGGNGKGMINDLLLLALGNYGLLGNNAILFESSKTGGNPEKANMHKKRLVIFREPAEKHKFENSTIKELTGGGTFSARSLYEKESEKELNATIIVECNKKPLFAEDPTNAETRRIIDLYFRSTFTDDLRQVKPEEYVFLANPTYKTREFQEKHKFALLKILMREHAEYIKNNSTLNIPKSIADRTQAYLELSCNIVQWFKDNYELSDNNDICKLKDIFEDFVKSPFYSNLSKSEKRKYNKSFFVEYFENNVFLKKYFRKSACAYSVQGWKKVEGLIY